MRRHLRGASRVRPGANSARGRFAVLHRSQSAQLAAVDKRNEREKRTVRVRCSRSRCARILCRLQKSTGDVWSREVSLGCGWGMRTGPSPAVANGCHGRSGIVNRCSGKSRKRCRSAGKGLRRAPLSTKGVSDRESRCPSRWAEEIAVLAGRVTHGFAQCGARSVTEASKVRASWQALAGRQRPRGRRGLGRSGRSRP